MNRRRQHAISSEQVRLLRVPSLKGSYRLLLMRDRDRWLHGAAITIERLRNDETVRVQWSGSQYVWSVDIPLHRERSAVRSHSVAERVREQLEEAVREETEGTDFEENEIDDVAETVMDRLATWVLWLRQGQGLSILEGVDASRDDAPLAGVRGSQVQMAGGWLTGIQAAGRVKELARRPNTIVYATTYSLTKAGLQLLGLVGAERKPRAYLVVDDLYAGQDPGVLANIGEGSDIKIRAASRFPTRDEIGQSQHGKTILVKNSSGWDLFLGSGNITGPALGDWAMLWEDGRNKANIERFVHFHGLHTSRPIADAINDFRRLWAIGGDRETRLPWSADQPAVFGQLRRPAADRPEDFLGRIPATEYKKPWPEQAIAHKQIVKNSSYGQATLLVMPPGAGKTLVAAELVLEHLEHHAPEGMRSAVWVSPSEVVAYQALGALRAVFEANSCSWDGRILLYRDQVLWDLFTGDEWPESRLEESDFVIVSNIHQYSTDAGTKLLDRLRRRRRYGHVVVDEAHHCGAATWKTALQKLASPKRIPADLWVLGLTATPWRNDAKKPEWCFNIWPEANVYEIPLAALKKRISTPRFAEPITHNLAEAPRAVRSMTTGEEDYSYRSLRGIGEDTTLNSKVTSRIGELIRSEQRKKILVYACSTWQVTALAKALKAEFHRVAAVFGVHSRDNRTAAQRQEDIQRFREIPTPAILINLEMLIEGYDVQDIDAVVLVRPTLSTTYYYQMIGRALRRSKHQHRAPLVTEVNFTWQEEPLSPPPVGRANWHPPIPENWGASSDIQRRLSTSTDLAGFLTGSATPGTSPADSRPSESLSPKRVPRARARPRRRTSSPPAAEPPAMPW